MINDLDTMVNSYPFLSSQNFSINLELGVHQGTKKQLRVARSVIFPSNLTKVFKRASVLRKAFKFVTLKANALVSSSFYVSLFNTFPQASSRQ